VVAARPAGTVDGVADAPLDERSAADARHSRLVGVKLRALVRDHLSDDTVGEAVAFAPGAALVHHGAGWVYLDERPEQRLGAALAWALRSGVDSLNVIAESGTGVVARRAVEFAFAVTAWHNEGRELWPAVPQPHAIPASVPDSHRELRALIEAGGAEPNEEWGVLSGEVRGLEVCRVVDDDFTGEVRLEVGIGAHDREAFTMLHGGVPTVESLARVVTAVEEHRRLDAPTHPFNRLARERLLRWQLMRDPSPVGARSLRPADPPVARLNLKDPVPCVAVGEDASGETVGVVCSVGIELDLIPYAADARSAMLVNGSSTGDDDRLVVVTPARDRIGLTEELAALLRRPVELASLD
jgi:hypothetical protein